MEPLDLDEVRKARRLEIRQMGVYTKVPAREAREAGNNMLGVRWVDVMKADGTYRSRMVAKDVQRPHSASTWLEHELWCDRY